MIQAASVRPSADQFAGTVSTVNLEAEAGRSDFYRRASEQHLTPLWRVLHGLVTETPQPACVPAQWKYRDVRPYVMEACSKISTEEADVMQACIEGLLELRISVVEEQA